MTLPPVAFTPSSLRLFLCGGWGIVMGAAGIVLGIAPVIAGRGGPVLPLVGGGLFLFGLGASVVWMRFSLSISFESERVVVTNIRRRRRTYSRGAARLVFVEFGMRLAVRSLEFRSFDGTRSLLPLSLPFRRRDIREILKRLELESPRASW